MRNLLAATALTTLMAFGGAAYAQDAQDTVPLTAQSVLATVNGTEITLGHVIMLRNQLPDEYRNLPDDVLWEGIVSQLIEQTLLAQQIDSANLPIAIVWAIENETRAQAAGAQIDVVIKRDISDEQIDALYAETVADMEPTPEYNASHILVETEDEAKALLEDLDAGADFSELAMEKSTGPSGPNGGDLGWFGLGMMVPEFELAVTTMEVGNVSAPVQTQFGWHVVKLDEFRETPVPSIDDMRPQLMDQLRQRAVEEEIETLKAAAEITQLEDVDPAVMRDVSLLPQ